MNCTFVDDEVTVKALIDPNSMHNSISKALAQKIGLYITREFRSEYPAVKELGIGATNAGKKVMMRRVGLIEKKFLLLCQISLMR